MFPRGLSVCLRPRSCTRLQSENPLFHRRQLSDEKVQQVSSRRCTLINERLVMERENNKTFRSLKIETTRQKAIGETQETNHDACFQEKVIVWCHAGKSMYSRGSTACFNCATRQVFAWISYWRNRLCLLSDSSVYESRFKNSDGRVETALKESVQANIPSLLNGRRLRDSSSHFF
jgi:hypothetical protein